MTFPGWLTSVTWVSVLAMGSIYVGIIVQGLIILNYPDNESQKWQSTLLCWSVIAVAVFVNTVVSGLLPMIEGMILVFHILGFAASLSCPAWLRGDCVPNVVERGRLAYARTIVLCWFHWQCRYFRWWL